MVLYVYLICVYPISSNLAWVAKHSLFKVARWMPLFLWSIDRSKQAIACTFRPPRRPRLYNNLGGSYANVMRPIRRGAVRVIFTMPCDVRTPTTEERLHSRCIFIGAWVLHWHKNQSKMESEARSFNRRQRYIFLTEKIKI